MALPKCSHVMWADASQHFNYQSSQLSRLDVDRVVNALGHQSAYGTLLGHPNRFDFGRGPLFKSIDDQTMASFADLLCSRRVKAHMVWNSSDINTAHILLGNTELNRRLVWLWLSMALTKPCGFCHSPSHDQATWSLLMAVFSLPVIRFADERNPKSISDFMQGLSERAFQFVLPTHLNWSTTKNGLSNGRFSASQIRRWGQSYFPCPLDELQYWGRDCARGRDCTPTTSGAPSRAGSRIVVRSRCAECLQ